MTLSASKIPRQIVLGLALLFFLGIPEIIQGQAAQPLPGIVGWWAGEGNAGDYVGVNNGTAMGGLSYGSGNVGQGFVFNGTNAGIKVSASSNLNVYAGEGFTIEAWMNPSIVSGRQNVAEWYDTARQRFGTQLMVAGDYGDGTLFAGLVNPGATSARVFTSAPGTIEANVWQHVAMTWEKATGKVYLYKNGKTVAWGSAPGFVLDTSTDFYIGTRPGWDGPFYYHGKIDEVTLYNRALGSNEVAAIFGAGSLGKVQPTLAPVIVRQPESQTSLSGANATFSVFVTGSMPCTYQWQLNGTNLVNNNHIAGALTNTILIQNVQVADSGIYSVIISNAYGHVVSSNAVLTVNSPPAVTIETPRNDDVVEAPADILVSSESLDIEGSIVGVEFYAQGATNNAGPMLIGVVSHAGPGIFSAQVLWTNVMAGNYLISAVAEDNYGARGTSAPVSITVNTALPLVSLNSPADNAPYSIGTNITLAASAADPDGRVTRVEFYAGTNWLGEDTRSPYKIIWSNVPAGSYTLTAKAIDDLGASGFSPPVNIIVGPISTAPIFQFERASYTVSEGAGSVALKVLKNISIAASVSYSIADAGAVPSARYSSVPGRLDFVAGQTSADIIIPIYDDSELNGNETVTVVLSLPSNGGSLGDPTSASVTILDDDAVCDSAWDVREPDPAPPAIGSLRINLEPPAAQGQWRLAWESAWRNSGTTLTGLPAGNYEIYFSPVNGYSAPASALVPVDTNGLVEESFNYTSIDIPQIGALSIIIEPNDVATNQDIVYRGQWRREGESIWHDTGEVLPNLNAGVYTVQFKPIPGRTTPPYRQVWVGQDQVNVIESTYLISRPIDRDAIVPTPLAFSQITESCSAQLPYAFNGQIHTDIGWGSGVVVRERVVLTAAHLLFNDASLSYVTGVRWFFQRQAGDYEPLPQTPRGWYVFSGYAAQRTNDNTPGFSSAVSQNLDVAAMYFDETAGRGGYSGYMVSEPSGTEWLLEPTNKMLVGYPMDCSNPGKMHATAPADYAFSNYFGRVFSTDQIRALPGSSGGPLCVQFTNGQYYPSAIYLGGSGETVVRAINGAVADLINRAAVAGHGGENNVGGGVITITTGFTNNPFCSGSVSVRVGPQSAIDAGAAWRVFPVYTKYSSYTIFSTRTNAFPVQNGDFAIEFAPIEGYALPTHTNVTISCNQGIVLNANYTLTNPPMLRLTSKASSETTTNILNISGRKGTKYRIDYSDTLSSNWVPFMPVTLTNTNVSISIPGTNSGTRFYRTVWLE